MSHLAAAENHIKTGMDLKGYTADTSTVRISHHQGAWVAQSVEPPTLDFGSDHGLVVRGIKPCIRLCAVSAEPTWDSLSLSLCSSLLVLSLSFSLKIKK